MTYCQYINTLGEGEHELHKAYHDHQYGFPIAGDDELFGRLLLEINQAGLSWTTILKKQDNFRRAYHGFSIPKVARYGEPDFERLINDAGIIRNRLKIRAAIHNAQVIEGFQREYGSFKNWLDGQTCATKEAWTRLFKETFRFTGGEIVNEFLVSTGYLPGGHDQGCPVYEKVVASNPPWLRNT
ncbi:MAG: DNA-3-methyladenine glycosylase I [Saprospiraceae bacterium]